MLKFSFFDQKLMDFIRDDKGDVITKEFLSWDEADKFVKNDGLLVFGSTKQGIQKHCWNDPDCAQTAP
jgi:hypothetical protein